MRARWYDEIVDAEAALRPAYAALQRRADRDPLRPSPAVVDQLRDRPFDDDIRIFPVPLVLDDTEYRSVVQRGLAQRARALQRLFTDLVLGPQRILTVGIGLTRDLVEGILAAEGTSLSHLRNTWRAHDRRAIRFVYGPDLVRDPAGRWTVLEDNVGCVGGSADSFFAVDRYRAATGLTGCLACAPEPDLAIAVRRWLHRLGRDPADGVAAVLGCEGSDPWAVRLRENVRRSQILDALGVPVIYPGGLGALAACNRPTVLVNFDIGASWAFGPGVAMFNAPGTGVLGSKAWLPFVDDVIRCYTGEEPILATPATRLLTDGVLPADCKDWVIKTIAGRQGTEVFVLGWQSPERLDLLRERIRTEWSGTAAVAQRYVEPSRMAPAGPESWDDYRVEIRPVTYVLDWQEVYVSQYPAGKVISSYDARRLNNISQGACYIPVLREPCPHCVGRSGSPVGNDP